MRRFLLGMAVITFLSIGASSGEAWQVNIKNSCNKDVSMWATGEHLFTKPIDCQVEVKSGTTKSCVLPGAICPFDVGGHYYIDASYIQFDHIHCSDVQDICCCWNINVEVTQYGKDSCSLVRR